MFLDLLNDAFIDSLNLVPFLFVIFVIIEICENHFSHKINDIKKGSKNLGPIVGALFGIFPQCGFSVIAAMLYIKKMITKGTLIAVFISTSDEAIPILLANPKHFHILLPLIVAKLIIATIAGYLIDIFFKSEIKNDNANIDSEKGCCNHNISVSNKLVLFIHPIKHTINVFLFIFITTLLLNIFITNIGEENIGNYLAINSPIQPIIAAIIGLIPNCAISVIITILYTKSAISFGSTIAGLCSGAGLGLLVLFKKNKDLKDSFILTGMLVSISIICGIIIQLLH